MPGPAGLELCILPYWLSAIKPPFAVVVTCLDTTFSKGREHTHYAGLRRNLQVSHFLRFISKPYFKSPLLTHFKVVRILSHKILIDITPPPQPPYSIGGCGGGELCSCMIKASFAWHKRKHPQADDQRFWLNPKCVPKVYQIHNGEYLPFHSLISFHNLTRNVKLKPHHETEVPIPCSYCNDNCSPKL